MTRHFLRDDDLTPDEQAEVLALAADAVLALTQRLVTSPGLRLTGDRP